MCYHIGLAVYINIDQQAIRVTSNRLKSVRLIIPTCRQACWEYVVYSFFLSLSLCLSAKFSITDISGMG